MAETSVRPVCRIVPVEYRSNFRHLYFDIAWFGILNGSTLSFISVYMTRIGASAFQLGLFSASPAIITLLFALPSGRWLKNRSLDRSVFWSAVLIRIFYLFWVFIPILFAAQLQLSMFIGLTLLMSIPGTVLAISFNALFADAVPSEWRAHVAGVRNALLAVTFILTSLLCGYLLTWLPFPVGYQVVFGVGCLGAGLSTMHLWFIRLEPRTTSRPRISRTLGDQARPGVMRTLSNSMRVSVGLRSLTRSRRFRLPDPNMLRGPFGKIILIMFLFHLSLYLPGPLYPLYWVGRLHLTDQEISLGNALFFGAVFVGSTQLSRITRQRGHQWVMVLGAVVLSVYPVITGLMEDVGIFLINSVIGGVGWSLAGGAVNNYVLENIPSEDRRVYLAWYNLTLNAAILLSSLAAPILVQQAGLVIALLVSGGVRLLGALFIWRWGRSQPATDL